MASSSTFSSSAFFAYLPVKLRAPYHSPLNGSTQRRPNKVPALTRIDRLAVGQKPHTVNLAEALHKLYRERHAFFASVLVVMAPIHPSIASAYLGGFDYSATHFIRGLNNGGFLNTVFWWVTFTGSITFMVLITIALYLAGYRKEALVFALVFLLANVVAFGLKYAIARPRPSDLGVPPEAQPSFPSGHTTNAFAFATTLSSYHRKFSLVLFAWAVLIAFSRVYLGLHYVTDLIGGALVGIVVSLVVTRSAKRVDAKITRIANTPPPPTSWKGVLKLPIVFVAQFLNVAYALVKQT